MPDVFFRAHLFIWDKLIETMIKESNNRNAEKIFMTIYNLTQ